MGENPQRRTHVGFVGHPPQLNVAYQGIPKNAMKRLQKNPKYVRFFLTRGIKYVYPYVFRNLRRNPTTVPEVSYMATTITLPAVSSSERNRLLSVDSVRRRALERLYERREAVKNLICALEGYQGSREARLAQCVTLGAIPTSPSSFSRSRI